MFFEPPDSKEISPLVHRRISPLVHRQRVCDLGKLHKIARKTTPGKRALEAFNARLVQKKTRDMFY